MRTELVCLDGVELLNEYLEGTLDALRRDALDAHLAGCPRCAAFVKSYRATPRILREATLRAMPADLEQRVLGFLRERMREEP